MYSNSCSFSLHTNSMPSTSICAMTLDSIPMLGDGHTTIKGVFFPHLLCPTPCQVAKLIARRALGALLDPYTTANKMQENMSDTMLEYISDKL